MRLPSDQSTVAVAGKKTSSAAYCALWAGLPAALLAVFFVADARADSISLVTSRAAIAGTDVIDWGQLGSANSAVSNPSNVTSTGGLTAAVSKPAAANGLYRIDQIAGGQPASTQGWKGNFAVGDHLITTFFGEPGPITIDFGTNLVAGGGLQMMSESYDSVSQTFVPGPFTATVTAYDTSHTLIGTFTELGISAYTADNSAIFIGVQNNVADIRYLTFNVTSQTGNEPDFAVNALSIADTPVNSVPLPSTACIGLVLLGGLAGVAALYAGVPNNARPPNN